MPDNILVISVHPDDETLGCGGTLLKHRDARDAIHWLILTSTREPQWPHEVLEKKTREIELVAKAFGFTTTTRAGFSAAHLDQVAQNELLVKIRETVLATRPSIVYLIHGGDVNSDHRSAYEAACSVLKPFHLSKLGVRRILCFETLSSTEAAPPQAPAFAPNVFVDIGDRIERKIQIMELYASETHQDPMPRGPGAIRALARYRGATIAADYAEAFMLMREIG
jgi:LmbE family N-acetylglucosaminyl deacetylase